MKTVVLDGVSYVKASEIAKEFGYTSDYVGQLCRSEKVDARLVGRTWFVNPESVISHKKSKYSKPSPVSKSKSEQSDSTSNTKPGRLEVEPVLKSKTMKSIVAESESVLKSSPDERKLKVSYEFDDEALMPSITRKPYIKPQSVPVNPAGAQKVNIKKSRGQATNTEFQVSDLPDVALSGNLSVEGMSEAYESEEEVETEKETDENKATNIVKSEETASSKTRRLVLKKPKKFSTVRPAPAPKKQTVSGSTPVDTKFKSRLAAEKVLSASSPAEKKAHNPAHELKIAPLSKNKAISQKVDNATVNSFAPANIPMPPNERVSTFVLVSPLIATFIAVICVAFLFSASHVAVVEDSYQSSVELQMANLLELLRR